MAFQSSAGRAHFEVIDVERINVVEPDGRLALVIANSEQLPGGIVRGREVIQQRRDVAGLLFYNSEGTEAGGLIYNGRQTTEGPAAGVSFTLDQFDQDQVVGLQYMERNGHRRSGLNVWDRPTWVTTEEVAGLFNARAAASGPARDSVQQRIDALARGGGFGAQRVFVGSEDRTAGLRVRDTAGRERVRVLVDSADVARIEFLDEQGTVVLTIPDRTH